MARSRMCASRRDCRTGRIEANLQLRSRYFSIEVRSGQRDFRQRLCPSGVVRLTPSQEWPHTHGFSAQQNLQIAIGAAAFVLFDAIGDADH